MCYLFNRTFYEPEGYLFSNRKCKSFCLLLNLPKLSSLLLQSRESESMFSEHDSIADGFNSEQADLMSTMGERHMLQKQREHISRNHRHISSSLNLEGHEMSACKNQKELIDEESLIREGIITSTQAIPLTCASGKTSTRRSSRAKSASHSQGAKSNKTPKTSREEMCSGLEGNSHNIDESSTFL